MNCTECGYENPDNQRGCNRCGAIYNPPIGFKVLLPEGFYHDIVLGEDVILTCGAVGHGCEECYIKCDGNPMTQEEDDWAFMMEWEENNPYEY